MLKLRDFFVIYGEGYDRESPSMPRPYKSAMQCPLLVVIRLGAKDIIWGVGKAGSEKYK